MPAIAERVREMRLASKKTATRKKAETDEAVRRGSAAAAIAIPHVSFSIFGSTQVHTDWVCNERDDTG